LKKENDKGLKLIYVIYGQEKLLLEEALERLKKKLSGEIDLTLNYEEFRGPETNSDAILRVANTIPFFGSKRLIVVKEVDKLTVSDDFLDYIDNPSEFTHLVLMADKIDKRSKLFKITNKKGYAYEYKPPGQKELPKWIKEKFLKEGKKITEDAVRYICLNVDNDLMRIQNEVEKVCLYYQDKKTLNSADIEILVEKSSENTIFELVDLIGRRKEGEALKVLNNLIENGQPVPFLFHMMLRQFRLLLKTKVLLDKRGVAFSMLAKELKVPPFVVSRYREQSHNFSIGQLRGAHKLFLEAEIDFKTSRKEPRLILEMLIDKIIS